MVKRDTQFWTMENHRQRMRTADWGDILLKDGDHVIINGRLRQLVGKNLGFGVVEVTLKPLKNLLGDEI
jgi:hypothetical protein